ncbi:MAG: SH3 domain-containing protein [bacterium]
MSKNFLRIFIFILVSIFIFTCQNENKKKPTSGKITQESQEKKEISSVCIWDHGSVRAEPSRKAKWLSAMALGEKITWLGETKVDSADEKRKYLYVRLSDGTEGWASEYVVAVDASPAVIIKETFIYRRPDLITITDKELKPMDLIAVVDKKNEWLKVTGKQYKKKGWIQSKVISSRDEDIAVALLAHKAYNKKDKKETKEKIKSILNNAQFSNSIFISDLQEKYNNLIQEQTAEKADSLNTFE